MKSHYSIKFISERIEIERKEGIRIYILVDVWVIHSSQKEIQASLNNSNLSALTTIVERTF